MINKLIPRILNSSKDSRTRGKMEMNDALNISVTDDYGLNYGAQGASMDQDGNAGVIKPVSGNREQGVSATQVVVGQEVTGDDIIGGLYPLDSVLDDEESFVRRVVGKVEDPKAGVIYFFLFSNNTREMGVYAWDTYGYFNNGTEIWIPIYTTSEFNFSESGRVVGDVVHVSGGADQDFRPILYFTDDENEPRKLDVLRCVERQAPEANFEGAVGGFTPALFNNYTENSIHDKDLITACPRSPVVPPSFEFLPGDGRASDFRRVPGVQFAYQCVYASGEVSALSTYSDIAIPDQYLRQGVITGEIDLPQACRITINPATFDVLTISEEVVAFKILVRRGNSGAFFVVDEVDKAGPFGTVTTYDFFNDRVLIGITESEENKQFDNLPRRAQAMSVIENRLFYGNYVEGYDDVPLEGTVEPTYIEDSSIDNAFELVATPIVMPLSQFNGSTVPSNLQRNQQRTAGVAIDTSVLSSTLSAGSTINVSFRFEPGENISLYNVDGGYHSSRITGGVRGDVGYNAVPFDQTFDTSETLIDYSELFTGADQLELAQDKLLPAVGAGIGVGALGGLEWVQTEGSDQGESSVTQAVIGTSAGSPLKLKGGVVQFSLELELTESIENAPSAVARAIGYAMSGQVDSLPPGITIIQSNIDPSYNFNHGLRSVDPIQDEGIGDGFNLVRLGVGGTAFNPDLAINVPTETQQSALDCITPVYEKGTDSQRNIGALGHVIVNEANVAMKLVYQPSAISDPLGECILTMEVASLTNVDVLTCVPVVTAPDLRVRQWRIFSGEYLNTYQITDINYAGALVDDFHFSGTAAMTTSAVFFPLVHSAGETSPLSSAYSERRKAIGYLRPTGSNLFSVDGSDIYITNQDYRDLTEPTLGGIPDLQRERILAALGTSMIDSEGGFKFSTPIVEASIFALGVDATLFQARLTYNISDADEGSVSSLMVMTGAVMFHASNGTLLLDLPFTGGDGPLNNSGPEDFALQNIYFISLVGDHMDNFYVDGGAPAVLWHPLGANVVGVMSNLTSPLFKTQTPSSFFGDAAFVIPEDNTDQLQEVEVISDVFIDQLEISGSYRSFKSSAYHDLGIVYYDDRGRPGNVNLLPRVYVAGYSSEERGLQKGRVELEISLDSRPPEWAHQYQVVYAGNSTYQDFIQYSIAGAFVDEKGDTSTGRNIYLSLNHLQEDSQVSYAEAFGAVDSNGNKDLYTFVPGDQVRVKSYETEPGVSVFPNQMVFDIVDQKLLTGNTDASTEETRNPLDSGSADTPLFLQGSFLKLRDNPEAIGFNWSSVRVQGNNFSGAMSNWGKRCIVEIVRPKAGVDSDIRSYQETGLVFNVGRGELVQGQYVAGQDVYHQTTNITMRNGDVWWRRIPVNIQNHDGESYISLIPESVETDEGQELQVDYQPRFRNRYLESSSFTDTFPGANVNGFGKRKFYSTESAEVRRESSITYSDANDFSTRRIQYTSFNPFQAPFKDLPNEHGAINAFVEFSEFLLVIQEDKSSLIPVNRNMLSDASGGSQLISSDKIIGSQKFIPGPYGADNNRESVVRVDDSVYFANKSKAEVYRFLGGKVEVISRKGMNSFLRDAFQDNLQQDDMRVVSGYDPLNDEYILSIINLDRINYTPPSLFTQPVVQIFSSNDEGGGQVDFDDADPDDSDGDASDGTETDETRN